MNSVLRRAVIGSVITIGVATAAGVMGQARAVRPAAQTAPVRAAAPAPPAPAAPAQSGFPEGDGKKIVEQGCGGCHDLDMVKTAKHDVKG